MLRRRGQMTRALTPAEIELMHAYNSPSFNDAFAGTTKYLAEACGTEHAAKLRSLAIWAGAELCHARKRRWSFESYRVQIRILLAQAGVI